MAPPMPITLTLIVSWYQTSHACSRLRLGLGLGVGLGIGLGLGLGLGFLVVPDVARLLAGRAGSEGAGMGCGPR